MHERCGSARMRLERSVEDVLELHQHSSVLVTSIHLEERNSRSEQKLAQIAMQSDFYTPTTKI